MNKNDFLAWLYDTVSRVFLTVSGIFFLAGVLAYNEIAFNIKTDLKAMEKNALPFEVWFISLLPFFLGFFMSVITYQDIKNLLGFFKRVK